MKDVVITSTLCEFENNNKVIVLGEDSTFSIILQTLTFKGSNNILVLHSKTKFINSSIQFNGSNSVCYLNQTSNNIMKINLTLYNDSVYYQGKNNYFNGVLNCIISETKHVLIGDDCIFSFGIWMRTSDAHLIYDIETKKRINNAKNILLGSRVWIGQSATLLKGTVIGSGAVIGLGAITSKTINSNTLNAGSPVKEIKKNIFWDNTSTQIFNEEQIKEFNTYQETSTVKNDFSDIPDTTSSWLDLLKKLDNSNSQEKYLILKQLNIDPLVVRNKKKNYWFKINKK